MKLIRFPGQQTSPARGGKKPPSVAGTNTKPACVQTTGRLAVGSIPFTCAECGDSHRLDLHGVVFRQVEFYCQRCGSFYKVTNPAFAKPIK